MNNEADRLSFDTEVVAKESLLSMERPTDTVTHAILEVEWLKSMQMVNNERQNQEGAEYLR